MWVINSVFFILTWFLGELNANAFVSSIHNNLGRAELGEFWLTSDHIFEKNVFTVFRECQNWFRRLLNKLTVKWLGVKQVASAFSINFAKDNEFTLETAGQNFKFAHFFKELFLFHTNKEIINLMIIYYTT